MSEMTRKVSRKAAYHHGDLRTQLVTATRLLVEAKGPEGFSVAESARTAGVSSAAPYRHFTDRAAMLEAVAIDGMQRLTSRFDAVAMPHAPGSLEAITALGQAYVAFAGEGPGVFRLMFAAHGHDSEAVTRAGQACFGRLLRQVGARLGVEPESEPARAVSLPLWTFVHGAAFLTIDGKLDKAGSGLPMDRMIADSTARLLAGTG